MQNDSKPQQPPDDLQRLTRFLPTVIREIQYAREWCDAQLASVLEVPRSTLTGWRNGEICSARIKPEVLERLRSLRNNVQPMLLAKGLTSSELSCVCNLSDFYEFNYQARAEARTYAVLNQSRRHHPSSSTICLDFRIRSAFLPHYLQRTVFCGEGQIPSLFVLLTNHNLPRSAQLAHTWHTIFQTAKATIARSLNPDIYFRRRLSASRSRTSTSLPPAIKHHPPILPVNNAPLDSKTAPTIVPSSQEVSDMLKDICYGIGYPAVVLASYIGVHPSTITRWLKGDVLPEDQSALKKLVALSSVAAPILRMKFINPFDLKLVRDTIVQPTSQAVNFAFETLRTTIEQENITDPVRRFQLDIHIRGADLPAAVTAHCLANRTTPPDLFVILVNRRRYDVFGQLNAAFEEIQAHILPAFPSVN